MLIQKSGYVLPLAFDANGRILCSILSFILLCVFFFLREENVRVFLCIMLPILNMLVVVFLAW